MTKIYQPPELADIIDELRDRIKILEQQPARALEIRDSSGNIRIRSGVAPQTNSLAAFDALGNSIFDTSGLQQVEKSIGGWAANVGQLAQPFTTTMTNHPLTNGNFTLTRSGTVKIESLINYFTNGGTASYGYARIAVYNFVGSLVAASISAVHTNGSGVSTVSPYLLMNLVPDTYTGWIQYSLDAGATTTWQMSSGQWDAFLLGG